MKFLPLFYIIIAILNFHNVCCGVPQNDSALNSESFNSQNDILLADAAGDDEHATDAKQKRNSFSFLPPSSTSSRQSSSNHFRELLNRNNDGILEIENPHESSYLTYRGNSRKQQFETHSTGRQTREVLVKQGRLIGIVRDMSAMRLKNVDQFLGIPYASAQRFMPPSSPLPWQNVKYANKLESVCPQKLPNLVDSSGYNKGRYDQIKRILPFLKNESEDCLNLNLYVPSLDDSSQQRNYPVIVFLHESFEWNSGNSYDGSILASYGQLIVITLNYRLGALGFLKPGLNDQIVANFGLLDIIAALQWIKENISSFGGNKNLVTLLGYDHGAIFANFLMISPIARGLFHRTILMSGSALADWALNYNPQQITQQVAKKLNCPMEDIQLGDCLRGKSYREIMNVSVAAPEFATIFGPIIDGLVVPSEPHQVMAHNEAFGRFDMLFGMTELESFNILGRDAIENGISQVDRDHSIRKYLANRFDKRLEVAFLSTLKEYSNSFMKSKSMSFHDHRDMLLEMLSDARVAAPLIHTGIYLSRRNPKCYMYVFAHNAEAGEHATISQSIHGEDLPFVFGAPLGNAGPFQTYYNAEERLLSEAVMRYFTNFAKTGNPTVPWNHRFHNLNPIDWDKYDVDWQEFNEINQNYLHLGTQPIVSQRYRHKYTKYWNEELIETMRNANSLNQYGKFSNSAVTSRTLPSIPSKGQMINMFPIKVEVERQTEDPLRELRYRLQQNPESPYYSPNAFMHSRGQMYGTSITSTESINYEQIPTEEHEILTNEATTMYLLISVIVTFLLVNMVGLFIYLYRRNKKINRKYDNANIFDAVSEDKRSKFNDTDDSFILDILRKSSNNTYESVKRHSLINGYGINRQMSTSTVDTHMKVNDWISNEIIKCSPHNHANGTITHSQQNSFSTSARKEKVSVAIDATPQARSNSILRQEPIEVTKAKSMDYSGKIICQEVDMDVSMIDEVGIYSQNDSIEEKNESDSSSCSCSSFSQCCEECVIQELKMPYHQIHSSGNGEIMTSFISDNVNVTSRDSPLAQTPLTPEESLKVIQKMNCPKVLPDKYPDNLHLNDATKRRSLQVPPQYYQIHGDGSTWDTFNRQNSSSSSSSSSTRPEPPPRLSSTLGRRPSKNNEDQSSNFMTMPIKAQEPPKSIIPVDTTESTLIVGPIVPKSENIYMTMQRKKSLTRQNSTTSSDGNKNSSLEDNSKISLNYSSSKEDDENTPIYSEIIKNSRVQTPQDGIYSITTSNNSSLEKNKHLERKSSSNSQESNSSTSSSSESSTGTIKKIN
ncbi:hypothetical protein PVAND_009441 [Polypedilum vanderplanki]|uniref:Carboxylesterase type B domain-containing protein n=1 Tax=Polypedilum vanderplanki TaxID=319348 RepID=A0A9J6CCL0_POLVA|nr:hypothetical protein PVAND_009441 [Polypedilum vanderplanki]